MLLKVKVRNFQSIDSADIPIGGFTVIVGPSDVGKSALVRAITAVAENRRGGDCVRRGAHQAQVALIFDKMSVLWERAKTVRYVLSKDGAHSVYNKIGTSVPPEIEEELRIGGISTRDATAVRLNLSSQFDPPFLLTESSPARAKLLSTITGAGFLLEMVARIVNRQRANRSEVELIERDLKLAETIVEKYHIVDGIKLELTHVRQDWEILQSLQVAITNYQSALGHISKLQDVVAEWTRQTLYEMELGDIESGILRLQGLEALRLRLIDLDQRINLAHRAAGMDIPDPGHLEHDLIILNQLAGHLHDLTVLTNRHGRLINVLQAADEEEGSALVEEQRLRQVLKTCPLCGSLL